MPSAGPGRNPGRLPPDTRTGVEGDLAESWTVSDDGSEYTFKLRAGIVDHEGNALTADDIYWGMVRYVERPNGVSVRRQGCVRNYVKSIWDDNGLLSVFASSGLLIMLLLTS